MAISAGDLTTLRASGAHVVKPHLNVVPKVTIGTMLVNQTTFSYPRNAITVDTISLNGGLANLDAVPLNSQVWIGTASGGHDVMMSALANRSASASALYVHGFGQGDPGVAVLQPAALANNQYITILAAKPLWGYLSRISAGAFYKKFDQSYTDEGSAPAPVCNIGPWQRVALTGASVNVTFTNAAVTDVKPASFAWGSATITGYQWAFRNESYTTTGAAFSGSSTSAAATITFSTAGFYIVSCTITDSAGKTHSADTYVWIVDGSTEADIAGWRVENDVQNREGRRITIVMDGSVAETVVYPGAGFLYSEEQTFNAGSTVTAGATVTSFVGFIDEERGIRHRAFGQVEFDLVSPSFVLDRIAMAPQYIQEVSSPADWTEVTSTLSHPNGIAWYVLQHHCPAMLQLFDFDKLADAVLRDKTWTLNGRSVWAQLREIAGQQINAGCISSGGLVLRYLPWLMSSTDRTALDNRMTWTAADLDGTEPLEYPTRFRLETGTVDAYAFSYDGTTSTPYWSRAPGDAQAQGPNESVYNGLIVPSSGAQTRLNAIAGHLFAYENNPTPQLALKVRRNLDTADPALMRWHAITITAAMDPRGIGYTARKFVPEQITRTWDQTETGSWLKRIELVGTPETAGQAGMTKPVPTDTDSEWDPSGSWIDFADYPAYEDDKPALPSYIIVAHYASARVALGVSADNFATAPVYTDISTGLVGSIRWMKGDPFNARRYFCATTDGLYRCDDVTTTSPYWYKVLGTENVRASERALGFHYVEMTPHRQGLIIVVNYTRHYQISFDYGQSWHLPTETPSGAGNGRNYWGTVHVSPLATNDHAIVWLRSPRNLRKSIDWGLTYAAATAAPVTEYGCGPINLPLFKSEGVPNDPAGLQTMYLCSAYNGNVVAPGRSFNVTTDSVATWATYQLGTATGAGNWGAFPSPSMRSIQSYTSDGSIIFAVQRTNGTPPSLRTVWSIDGGVTAIATAFQPTALTNIDGANVNGWATDPARWLCWGFRDVSGPDGGFIACTADAGATAWVDLLGNLVSDGIFADGQIAYAEWLGI